MQEPLMEMEEIGPRGRDSIPPLSPAELNQLKGRVKQLEEIAVFNRKNHGPNSSRYKDSLKRYNAAREHYIESGGNFHRSCCCCCCCC